MFCAREITLLCARTLLFLCALLQAFSALANSAATASLRVVTDNNYLGVQFAAIPEYAPIGDAVGRAIADAVSGRTSTDSALARSQSIAQRFMASRDPRSP